MEVNRLVTFVDFSGLVHIYVVHGKQRLGRISTAKVSAMMKLWRVLSCTLYPVPPRRVLPCDAMPWCWLLSHLRSVERSFCREEVSSTPAWTINDFHTYWDLFPNLVIVDSKTLLRLVPLSHGEGPNQLHPISDHLLAKQRGDLKERYQLDIIGTRP